ncbi:Ribokinase-like protein [Dentipellis sp. KUC8613]|nr:Ribokinase-like protein [Dentipellis sp. KUC8613]
MAEQDLGRVLSVQSHVSFGYVGGKAAVFPLQVLGFDVDVVNTVNFSNHSGYGRFGGTRANAADLRSLFTAMEENGFLRPSRLLTGYIPGAEALTAVAELAKRLHEQNSELIYLLDPVIGDSGKMYVAPDVVPIYRSLLPWATVITPNWFEVEILTHTKITDRTSLQKALETLHETHSVPNVVISSIPLKSWLFDLLPENIRPHDTVEEVEASGFLLCIASSRAQNLPSPSVVHAGCVPLIPGYFSGVGDLFSAFTLAHFNPPTLPSSSVSSVNGSIENTTGLADAVSLALTKTHAILQRTHIHALSLPPDERLGTDDERDAEDPERRIRRMRGRELRLIQSQDIIRGEGLVEMRTLQEWEDFWVR